MSVYVDEVLPRGGRGRWCHLMTDGGPGELHAFAAQIGVGHRRFHNPQRPKNRRPHPHYDLTAAEREQALHHGAIPVSGRELVQRCILKQSKTGP